MIDSPLLGSFTFDMQEIQKRHADLIRGLNEVYAILIEMRYLYPDELVYPPYGVHGKPPLAKAQLQAAGYEPEAIAVMELLPYPSNEALERWSMQEAGMPIAPHSGAMSYLEGHEFDRTVETSRQPFRDGETGIPAWAFKLTFGGAGRGTTYIYDTNDTTMRRWDSLSESTEYWGQPSRGTRMALKIWLNEIRTLDWIPWRDESEGFETLNVHARPSLLSTFGATNRFEECENEFETLLEERTKYKRYVEEARRANPTLDAAIRARRKRSGTLGLNDLKELAVEHGIDVQKEPPVKQQPDGWGIGWVLDKIERKAPDNQALRRQVLSMRNASAQQLRAAAIEHGISIAHIPKPPAPPPSQSHKDMRLEIAKAALNMFACKKGLFLQCGWSDNFQSGEFERRRREFEEEFHAFFTLLGPRSQNISDPEDGAWLRQWYRERAGDMAV